jgi:hypothetical protein
MKLRWDELVERGRHKQLQQTGVKLSSGAEV